MKIAVAAIKSLIEGISNKIGEKIGEKIVDEASLIFNFSGDFRDLKERLDYLQLFLDDASDKSLHAPKSKLFQRWITDLSNVAKDVDALVQICSRPLDRLLENDDLDDHENQEIFSPLLENHDLDDHENQGKGICSCIFCVPFSWLKKNVRQLVSYPKIGKQIKEVKARLNHLTNQANVYGIRQNENVINASLADDEVAELLLESEILYDESVDIEPKKKNVLSLIDQHRVVAVVGMAGSGKTRLLKEVFKSLESSSRYEKCIWLCLSQKFTIETLQRDVLVTLDINPKGSQPILAAKIHKELQNQNYVVVFDDIWALSQTQRKLCQSMLEKLRKIGLPEHSGSRTLISTRDREVAHQLGAEIYDMPPLSTEKSRELLLKHLPSQSEALMIDRKLRSLFDAVLRRCGGLPLPIIAAAGALQPVRNVDEMRFILQEIMSRSSSGLLSLTPDPLVVAINAFGLSYNALDDKAKSCFEFLGVLAEDESNRANNLVAMWKAERLVESRKQGMEVLMHLWHRSLLQLKHYNYNPQGSCVRMHDIAHDLAVDMAQLSGGVFEIEAVKEALLQKQKIYRISLAKVPLALAVTSVSCPRSACTLRLTHDESLTEIPSQFLAKACDLRVLDLSRNTRLQRLPINCLKNMRLLRFLDIRFTEIRELPECVRHLTSLEFLGINIHGDVPVWIGELQCLEIFTCGVPNSIDNNDAIWDTATVVPMPQLWRLERITVKIKSGGQSSSSSSRDNNDNNKPELWSWDSLSSQLTQLEHVTLSVEEFEDGKTPPCTLRFLHLKAAERDGRRGMIMSMPAEWLQHLNNLKELWLNGINFPIAAAPQYVSHSPLRVLNLIYCAEYSSAISHLPELRQLAIMNNSMCKNLPAEFGRKGAFPSLITLVIVNLEELRTLPTLETEAMPRLSNFKLIACRKLQEGDGWKEKLRTLAETGQCEIEIRGIKRDFWVELNGAIQRQ